MIFLYAHCSFTLYSKGMWMIRQYCSLQRASEHMHTPAKLKIQLWTEPEASRVSRSPPHCWEHDAKAKLELAYNLVGTRTTRTDRIATRRNPSTCVEIASAAAAAAASAAAAFEEFTQFQRLLCYVTFGSRIIDNIICNANIFLFHSFVHFFVMMLFYI